MGQYSNVQLGPDYFPDIVIAASESFPQLAIELSPSMELNEANFADEELLSVAIDVEEYGVISACSDQTQSNSTQSNMNEFWVGNSVDNVEFIACTEAISYCSHSK